LRDGVDYEFKEKTYEWVGVKKLLIPYIYSMWLRDTYDQHSGIGIVLKKGENSHVINPRKRIARAFNKYSEIAGDECNKQNTLYGFLSVAGDGGGFDNFFDDFFEKFGQYLDFSFKAPGTMNTQNI
jgi:hypothetical protein